MKSDIFSAGLILFLSTGQTLDSIELFRIKKSNQSEIEGIRQNKEITKKYG